MGYVTDSIQFRTGSIIPLPHIASVFNHVRDVILSTGMVQVSLGDWPNQIGDVVTGVAAGNDVSLDDLTITGGYNKVGSWVFKHPNIDMYVRMEVGLLADYLSSINNVRLPRFLFTCGRTLDIGSSEFSGSTVSITPMKSWYTSNNGTSTNTFWGVGSFPRGDFILRSYCGRSGFWIYADGGCMPISTASTSSIANPLPRLSILAASFLVDNSSSYRIALDSPSQVLIANRLGLSALGNTGNGVYPYTYFSGTWREQLPGSFGLLDAPHVLSTDKGIRVAQAQLYGAGAPVPLPLAMVQASFEEVPFRLDLDGSGERTWVPVPAYQAVQFVMDAAPPANLQNHCIYALPASDD